MATTETELQRLLDALSQQPGALLYRGEFAWQALPPGQLGQVLAIGANGMPQWMWPEDVGL